MTKEELIALLTRPSYRTGVKRGSSISIGYDNQKAAIARINLYYDGQILAAEGVAKIEGFDYEIPKTFLDDKGRKTHKSYLIQL